MTVASDGYGVGLADINAYRINVMADVVLARDNEQGFNGVGVNGKFHSSVL
jgi:hypothetical protein